LGGGALPEARQPDGDHVGGKHINAKSGVGPDLRRLVRILDVERIREGRANQPTDRPGQPVRVAGGLEREP
jgi:hypothetical protein